MKINASQTTAGGTLDQGLVGYWTFDGKDTNWTSQTAGTVADRSPVGTNTGTLTGMSRSSSPTIGKIGQGLKFNGSSAYVSLGTGLDNNGEMTISAWIRTTNVSAGTRQIVANGSSDGTQQDYTFEINRTARKLSTIWGNNVILTGNATLSVNTWYHAVMVRSGSSGNWAVKFYLNGNQDNSGTTAINPNATNENTAIGRGGGWASQFFSGTLDDVRIYNRVLSASEVKQLYNMGR